MNNLVAFGWFGGKQYQLDWLRSIFPSPGGVQHFVDVFGGSAAVIMNVGPYPVETYNDINSDVVHFFRTLRERPEELIKAVMLTPYSREEFAISLGDRKGLRDIERARRFYIATKQSIGNISNATPGQWGYTKHHGKAKNSLTWANGMEKFWPIVDRFRSIQVENRPALDVIRRMDAPTTLLYCDPPYVLGSRTGGKIYTHEMDDGDHRDLAEALRGAKAKVVLSGYHSPLYDELYAGWHTEEMPNLIATRVASRGTNRALPRRQEVVWCNFEPGRDRLL